MQSIRGDDIEPTVWKAFHIRQGGTAAAVEICIARHYAMPVSGLARNGLAPLRH